MRNRLGIAAAFGVGMVSGFLLLTAQSGQPVPKADRPGDRPRDPAAEVVTRQPAPADRPEAKMSEHDQSDKFDPKNAAPVSPALKGQPNEGKVTGIDFNRDPFG